MWVLATPPLQNPVPWDSWGSCETCCLGGGLRWGCSPYAERRDSASWFDGVTARRGVVDMTKVHIFECQGFSMTCRRAATVYSPLGVTDCDDEPATLLSTSYTMVAVVSGRVASEGRPRTSLMLEEVSAR